MRGIPAYYIIAIYGLLNNRHKSVKKASLAKFPHMAFSFAK